MSLVKLLLTGGALYTLGKRLSSDFVKDFWHNLSYSVPPEDLKVEYLGGTNFIIDTSLVIENNHDLGVTLRDLHTTVYYKNKKGDLVQFAVTPPNRSKWVIGSKITTKIKNIRVKISAWNALGAIPAYFNNPEGEKFKIMVSGSANLVPFSTEIWY
ncbi:MAG: hypothetical protein ACI8ZM_002479 [Crocinitomix sp.]|jgi:hypothetical protein